MEDVWWTVLEMDWNGPPMFSVFTCNNWGSLTKRWHGFQYEYYAQFRPMKQKIQTLRLNWEKPTIMTNCNTRRVVSSEVIILWLNQEQRTNDIVALPEQNQQIWQTTHDMVQYQWLTFLEWLHLTTIAIV